jgi:hypothetical protein
MRITCHQAHPERRVISKAKQLIVICGAKEGGEGTQRQGEIEAEGSCWVRLAIRYPMGSRLDCYHTKKSKLEDKQTNRGLCSPVRGLMMFRRLFLLVMSFGVLLLETAWQRQAHDSTG